VPEEWYERDSIRRYGFHGSSHRYVATRAAAHLDRSLSVLKMITLHLGNGASVSAIASGRCVDTSMGFTPLEGLVMGTRSGDLDPAVPLHMQKVRNTDAEEIQRVLNRESGLKGLCGTNDMREVLARAEAADPDSELALDLYCYRIKKYIGAYTAVLGGLDVLVFTGGVGENAAEVRKRACQGIEVLGVALDEKANSAAVGEVVEIGRSDVPVRTLVVRTNEELQIAQEALEAVRGQRASDALR